MDQALAALPQPTAEPALRFRSDMPSSRTPGEVKYVKDTPIVLHQLAQLPHIITNAALSQVPMALLMYFTLRTDLCGGWVDFW